MSSDAHAWFVFALGLYCFAIQKARFGLKDSTSWFAVFFIVVYSGNVIGYPLALSGNQYFEWLLDSEQFWRLGPLTVLSMSVAWVTHLLIKKRIRSFRWISNLAPLSLDKKAVSKSLFLMSVLGSSLSIVLSLNGFSGYFMSEAYWIAPPAWLDLGNKFVGFAALCGFLMVFSDYVRRGRLSYASILVLFLMFFQGIVAGFKTYVLLPGLFLLLAGWINRRMRAWHFLLALFLIVLAYSVVEPMRDLHNLERYEDPIDALHDVVFSDQFSLWRYGDVVDEVLRRADYTTIAVKTLESDSVGGVSETRARVKEYYDAIPLIAFAPRAFWPDKPLQNIGAVLSTELTGNEKSAVTPGHIVFSFLWLDSAGVAINSMLWAVLVTLGGQVAFMHGRDPLRYAPYMLLGLLVSNPSSFFASYYVDVIRAGFLFIVFYRFGLMTGVLSFSRKKN